ncbi:MAG TPA: isoprenylcysteine carboxylmethyltransferase family protein [Thermoanaerobaculia bacterium]|nr:isoprenylcysteine carboxylmethyltransferase family protein [Thermoanaerobaculia bacterium]
MILFLKNLLFTVLIPGTVGVYLPLWLAGRRPPDAPAWAWLLSAPLFLVGAFVYFWCLWNFAVTGRGTPAPIDPPKKLIIRGPHKYSRNPMYLGVLSVVSSWAVLFRSPEILRYGVVVALMFHLVVLVIEEPSLRRLFGAEYEQYCQSVRRWIPTLPIRGRLYTQGKP